MPKKLLLIIFCMAMYGRIWAQEPTSALDLEIQRAQRAYDIKKYNTAASMYKKIYPKVKEEEKQNKILYMIAESYRRANNFKQAYDWYEKLVNTKYPDPRILYSYGLLLKNYERYDDAARQFSDYLFESPNDLDALREQKSCAIAQEWKSKPEKFDIKNEQGLNTVFSDYAPFYVSGKLVWSSSRTEATGSEIFEWTGQKCSDLFEASLLNGSWTKPANLKGGINSNYNEGVAWFDSTYTTSYYTQCNGTDGKGVNCKIYETQFRDGKWTAPVVLPFCSDSFSVGHPSMSVDGKRLFFASNMPGGYGEKDIYYIDHNALNESWGKAVNLGPNVNSTDDDMFPMVDEKGVVYYASKGRQGMGGLDLFKTQDSASTFTLAQNLRSPINSGGDDFGLSFSPVSQRVPGKAIGYFSSNRVGGMGDDDIYSITIKPFVFMVKGKVFERDSITAIANANAQLKDADGRQLFAIKTNAKGEFSGEIPANMLVNLGATKEKYFSSSPIEISSLGLQHDSIVELKLYLDPIPTEDVEFVLQGIYYDLDKYDLRPASKVVLDSLVTILKLNPTLVIELASHTDSRAPADYNLTLSQKRAQACVNYLVQKGISKARLDPVGYGETKLMNDCSDGVDCSEEEHQLNRRTTFRVLKTDYKGK